MNRFEKFLSKFNFKKIAVVFIILALAVGIGCGAAVGLVYKDRLVFAYEYSKLEDTLKKGAEDEVKAAVDKVAASSDDVKDILILDGKNNVSYSAKNSEFAQGTFAPIKTGDEKKYLASDRYPDAIFRYVKGEEFMLNSILNKDFGKIKEDYDEDGLFETDISEKTVYMLTCVSKKNTASKICIISVPTAVPYGMLTLKISAVAAMFFFCIYWVLVALWLYRDAARSKLSPLGWGLIGLCTNVVGVIVYKIYKHGAAVCADCGAAQNASNKFCVYCGKALGSSCPNCGSKIGAKDSFCHECGAKLK